VPARPSAKGKLEQVKALGNEEGWTILRGFLEKETLQEVCISAEFGIVLI
jgi:hypothetical protein